MGPWEGPLTSLILTHSNRNKLVVSGENTHLKRTVFTIVCHTISHSFPCMTKKRYDLGAFLKSHRRSRVLCSPRWVQGGLFCGRGSKADNCTLSYRTSPCLPPDPVHSSQPLGFWKLSCFTPGRKNYFLSVRAIVQDA